MSEDALAVVREIYRAFAERRFPAEYLSDDFAWERQHASVELVTGHGDRVGLNQERDGQRQNGQDNDQHQKRARNLGSTASIRLAWLLP